MSDAELSLSAAERVDAACDRFEAEWKAGRGPRIEDYVAAALPDDRERLFAALRAVEEELRQRAGLLVGETSVSGESLETHTHPGAVSPPTAGVEGPERVGRFEVRAVLGTGAFGRVYRAFDPHLGREVAVKVPVGIDPGTDERDRFLREARAAAGLRHPNVCPIYEVGEDAGRPYIVMALIEGQSLGELLKQHKGPLPERQAAIIVRKIALALQAAHAKGVVHRDLKPANVMLDQEQKELVVMDFGLARGPRPGDARDTQSGTVMGTPAYMAPEQARGDTRAVGPAADIWALGVILYELLADRRPFAGTATEVLGQVLHVEPDPPSNVRPGIDPRLEAICLTAMAKVPAARFASMAAFAAAVDDYLRAPARPTTETARAAETVASTGSDAEKLDSVGLPLGAEQQETVPADSRRPRIPRRLLVLVGVLIVGGLAVLAGIVFFTRNDKVRVSVELADVDLADTTLSYALDEEPVTAETLAAPVELTPGEHVLVVKREKDVVKRFLLSVTGGRTPGITVRDITPPPKAGPPSPVPASDRAFWSGPLGRRPVPEAPGRPAAAPDRLFAQWANANGGHLRLRIGGEEREIPAGAPLPPEPFRITSVVLAARGALKDADLEPVGGLTELRRLDLHHNPQLGPDALKPLRALTGLEELYLPGDAGVTDAGLEHIRHLRGLKVLNLASTGVTDAGVARLAGAFPDLTELHLTQTAVTDAALAHLPKFPQLTTLVLGSASVTDKGLAHIAGLRLTTLGITSTQVTDAGMKALGKMSSLEELRMRDTAVTDAGLRQLEGLVNLRQLDVRGAKVTADGVRKFHSARARCRIVSDHGPFEPVADLNRAAAEWVFCQGGGVRVEAAGGEVRRARDSAELPAGPFRVQGLFIDDSSRPLDKSGLDLLGRLDGLQDFGIEHEDLTDDDVLRLGRTPVA